MVDKCEGKTDGRATLSVALKSIGTVERGSVTEGSKYSKLSQPYKSWILDPIPDSNSKFSSTIFWFRWFSLSSLFGLSSFFLLPFPFSFLLVISHLFSIRIFCSPVLFEIVYKLIESFSSSFSRKEQKAQFFLSGFEKDGNEESDPSSRDKSNNLPNMEVEWKVILFGLFMWCGYEIFSKYSVFKSSLKSVFFVSVKLMPLWEQNKNKIFNYDYWMVIIDKQIGWNRSKFGWYRFRILTPNPFPI